ncbi:MAG: DUF2939 domain-containing protein [Acetobacteraceae bacterium]
MIGPLAGAAVILAGLYVAGPTFALLRLRRAAREGNVRALHRLVDFPALRRGLAHQLAASALGAPAGPQGLAPFGFSFVAGIAQHEMAVVLTPASLIRMARQGPVSAHWHFQSFRLDSPTEVTLRLHAAGEGSMGLTMRMEGGGWRLTGIRMPAQEWLRVAAARAP